MERYIFSGGISNNMIKYLKEIPEYKPMNVLVSQLDRSSVNKMISLEDEGFIESLFIDSGAYSEYTGKIKHIDVDEYCDFLNSIDDKICLCAQVDTLPGKFGEPKKPEDYSESSRKSWENYLYMRGKLKSPEKLIPVFHFGESFDTLRNMLEWRGENGEVVEVIGLSPANDSHQKVKDVYLKDCYNVIQSSSRPNAKTHLFGMTSLESLSKFPCYSADSVSHRLRTAYNKIYTNKWGTISLTDRPRSVKNKSGQSFIETCDEKTYNEFEEFCKHYGFTVEQMKEDNAARVAVDIVETQKAVEGKYRYQPANLGKNLSLF